MTVDELAQRMAIWLDLQPAVTEVEVLDTDKPPFGADPTVFLGTAFIGFRLNSTPMSLEISVTE